MDEDTAERSTVSIKLMEKAFLSLMQEILSKSESIIHVNSRPKIGIVYMTHKHQRLTSVP
jgi:hypothetical protein